MIGPGLLVFGLAINIFHISFDISQLGFSLDCL
jgi:hypothetical protein